MKNLFGTDGIRACVGTGPLTIEGLQKLGKAIAVWAQKKYTRNPIFLLAHDTRISSSFVKASLKSGLMLYPITVYDGDVLPSPAVVQLLQHRTNFNVGIIISASHNPYYDNGIKVVDGQQGKLSLEDELLISNYYYEHYNHFDYGMLGVDSMWQQAQQNYIDYLIRFFKPNFLVGKKIVLDCANGALYKIAPLVFRLFGAEIIILNDQPNGFNINKGCGAVYPEVLQRTVIEQRADAGFAFDGDADRVIAVNRYGQLKNGDDILAMLLEHPLYSQSSALVGTSMSNQGFELFLQKTKRKLLRTLVGDKYVAAAMIENNLMLGGEPSGHIIARDYLNTGDGLFIALRILETLDLADNWDMNTFTKFPQIIINVPVEQKKDLNEAPLAQVIYANQQLLIAGRLVVRYSGTEHLLRIMIEDTDFEHAQTIGNQLSKQLLQLLT